MLKLIAIAAVTMAFAQPTTLTLACKGTTSTYLDKRSDPISLGLLVDFTKRTIKGFPYFPDEVEITEVTELVIYFHKSTDFLEFGGSMDRLTGEVKGHLEANKKLMETTHTLSGFDFALKCTPTQRMF